MDLSVISVSAAKKKQFATKGIYTAEDLLSFIPRRYKDYSRITGVLPHDQVSCVKAMVKSVTTGGGKKTSYVAASCVEMSTGKKLSVFWFNQHWIYHKLSALSGQTVVAVGKIDYNEQYDNYSMSQPEVFDFPGNALGIYPVYRSIAGMSTEYLTEKIEKALALGRLESENIPEDIVRREKELPMPMALQYIHSPKSMREAEAGMDRILLNDLLYFSLHNELNKAEVSRGSQYNVKTLHLMNAVRNALPYKLTADQESATNEMVRTAREGRRLHCLLVGDVGAGKTTPAALLAAAFIGSGYQVVMMAPTQVLAKQHLDTFRELFEPQGVRIGYLDSTLKARERKETLAAIASGEAKLVIGTHACIGRDVAYHKLALTIVDEEHKFGVKQRAAIIEKAAEGVHSITMSATPIPRSLAQVMYGDDIQLHTIKTMPEGRKPVITGISKDKGKLLRFLVKEVRKGHQAYVVCPMIDPSEKLPDVKSVETVSEEYCAVLEPMGVRVESLTGRDSKETTEDVIGRFKSGQIDVLIATTVIEVGVNVPNATMMIITNAERFGLSGLHQLRGRVGRSSLQSYCVLQSDAEDEKAQARLNTMCRTTDGFEIAEEDLKLRGTGDFLGTRQSGENKYVALMLANPDRYKTAVRLAKEIIDRGLDCCTLGRQVEEERKEHGEENAA